MSMYDLRSIVAVKVTARDAPKATPAPKVSMAEDAAICNARMRRVTRGADASPSVSHGADNNAERIRKAVERDNNLIPAVVRFLEENGSTTRNELAAAFGVSPDIMRRVLTAMKKAGMDIGQRKPK